MHKRTNCTLFTKTIFRQISCLLAALLAVLALACCSPGERTEPTPATTKSDQSNTGKVTTGKTSQTTTAGGTSGGLTSVEAVELVWPKAQKAFGDAVLWRMIPVNDKKSTEMQLNTKWTENDRSAAWFIWYADPNGENWLMYTIEGSKLAKTDIGTRSFSKMAMPAEWPRGVLKVSMKAAAAKAAAQGANLAKLTWVEFSCDYSASDVRSKPVWVFACSEETPSGSSLNYRVFVDALTGEVAMALNERNDRMALPIDMKALGETRADNHQGDVLQFFSFITKGDPISSVRQLSSKMSPNEASAQQWLANFQSLKSLKVLKVEQVRNEEWTAEWEAYKVTLEVSTSESPEKYGWDNGKNMRWITIIPQGAGAWKVESLAANP